MEKTKKLKILWEKFVKYFRYEKYFNKDHLEVEIKHENFVSEFFSFINENSITISNDYNLILKETYQNQEGLALLNKTKLWIMFIKLVASYYEETNYFINVFSFALNYDINNILLFEFFLILLDESDNTKDFEFLNYLKRNIPNKFLKIINKNISHLLYIFSIKNESDDDCQNEEDNLSFGKPELNFSEKKQNFEKMIEDLEKVYISDLSEISLYDPYTSLEKEKDLKEKMITNNFGNMNLFAVFNHPIHKFSVYPLRVFNLKDKKLLDECIDLLNQTYEDYTIYPFNPSFIT